MGRKFHDRRVITVGRLVTECSQIKQVHPVVARNRGHLGNCEVTTVRRKPAGSGPPSRCEHTPFAAVGQIPYPRIERGPVTTVGGVGDQTSVAADPTRPVDELGVDHQVVEVVGTRNRLVKIIGRGVDLVAFVAANVADDQQPVTALTVRVGRQIAGTGRFGERRQLPQRRRFNRQSSPLEVKAVDLCGAGQVRRNQQLRTVWGPT